MGIKRIQEIKKEVEETTEVGLKFFEAEFGKFIKRLSGLINSFNEESVKVKKEIVLSIQELEKIEEETKTLREQYKITENKVEVIDAKEIELRKREDELVELHTTLERKSKRLDAKERDLALSDSKTATPIKN